MNFSKNKAWFVYCYNFFFKKIWLLKINENSEFVVLELVGGSGEQDNCETKFEILLYHTTYVLKYLCMYFVSAK